MNSFVEYSLVLICAGVCVALVAPAACSAAEGDAPVFRAGAATCNITPPLGVPIVGNFEVPEATYIHDELHARCLVLDDGQQRLVFVICDNIGAEQPVYDQAKARLQEKTGIPPENMLMASTHTHSGPPARHYGSFQPYTELDVYQQFLADRIVDGVQCAVNNLEPAQIAWGSGQEPRHVFNRRWYTSDPSLMVSPFGEQDQVRMNPPRGHEALVKPAGPTDPEIFFIAVRSTSGRPIALLANYSLHYVGGVPKGHISADYFAVFSERIKELLGADKQDPPFVGMLSNGTSGDVNNIDFVNGWPPREPYEQMHVVANSVAAEVYRAYQTLEFRDHAQLGARMSKLTLTCRKPDEAKLAWAQATLDKPEDQTTQRDRTYAQRMFVLRDAPDTVDIWMQTVRVGDVGISAVPFETFAETGLRLKEECPLPEAFTISLANGCYSYLPTPAQHELGGYETWLGTNRVAVDSEPAIVERLLAQLTELAAK